MRKLHVEGEQVASRDSDDNENGAQNAATATGLIIPKILHVET